MKIYITKNEKETLALGEKFARGLKGGEVIGLTGELGAGKTVFIKGVARGLGIKKNITSPTFNIMKVYETRIKNYESRIMNFVHVDAYRLKNGDGLEEIGIKDYLGEKNAVVVIEWADKVHNLLKKIKYIKVDIRLDKKEDERSIFI